MPAADQNQFTPELLRQIVAEQFATLQSGANKGGGRGSFGPGPREVWGCSCGEKSNWSHRLNCRVCGLGRPDGLTAHANLGNGSGGGLNRGVGSAPASPGSPVQAKASEVAPTRAKKVWAQPAHKKGRDLARGAASPGSGTWVNLDDEDEDQLLMQLAWSKKAKAALAVAEEDVAAAPMRTAGTPPAAHASYVAASRAPTRRLTMPAERT